jgi:hypothetical protein
MNCSSSRAAAALNVWFIERRRFKYKLYFYFNTITTTKKHKMKDTKTPFAKIHISKESISGWGVEVYLIVCSLEAFELFNMVR